MKCNRYGDKNMPRGERCRHRGAADASNCGMHHLYRFIEPLILYYLTQKGSSYGYDLIDTLNRHSLTDSTIEAGALYRNLRRLEENGHVESAWDVSGSGPARRLYHLTPKGVEHLEEWALLIERLADSMKHFATDSHKLLADLKKKT